MADSHPYISGPGNISQMVIHLRKSFPKSVSSETVKKLGLASNNESYVIGALQFIGIIDDEGKKTPEASNVFSHHKDEEFYGEFSKLVKSAYHALFDLYGDEAWALETDDLITFFRKSDQTSDAIGRRQANTFKVFASLSGYGEIPATKSKSATKNSTVKKKSVKKQAINKKQEGGSQSPKGEKSKDIGLTVRVEINLPADGSKETYDNIFKSIKENLIDG